MKPVAGVSRVTIKKNKNVSTASPPQRAEAAGMRGAPPPACREEPRGGLGGI
eukprot:CAMPEP_0182861820 /NCGR_PEP_ID=MMETSP0034_2-20130328/5708_1 /TAXON_ID=156128 /ORGANISM="Nephroselmis pyriformis, Strain CCMP717" /LENGTH=51 /DNA_ID=CAMNT_0024993789 /DNA_START=33 /DNA_END=185 /DNA_ORIENTATION=-